MTKEHAPASVGTRGAHNGSGQAPIEDTSVGRVGQASLRRIIEAAAAENGGKLTSYTVLAQQNDPYRVDTPAGHRDGAWFAEQFKQAHRDRIHLRGLHYSIVARGDVVKPNGKFYVNTDADWTWLQNVASKAARWLGYVPFESIVDHRNDPPIIHRAGRPTPAAYIDVGVNVFLPSVHELEPTVRAVDFRGHQAYHVVIFGEKSSLHEAVLPIATRYQADLYLPTGEISDTLIYRMAKDGAEDGRPMRVFTLADCDPAGHQMPVSIGRKLQALRDLEFHDLDFEVRSIGLTVEQVRELDLPSTPLKETERRADRWRAAFGIEQTEIDALAALRPGALERIVNGALEPFFDSSLAGRVSYAKYEWTEAAQKMLDDHTDVGFLENIRNEAADKLAEIEIEIEKLNEALRQAVPAEVPLPVIEVPEPEVDETLHGKPLVSTSWSWAKQTRALIERKSYGNGRAA